MILSNIQQALRLLMLRQWRTHQRRNTEGGGGLLVLLWVVPDNPQNGQLNCTVAAAGPWCFGVRVEEIHHEFWQKQSASASPCSAPDPEELCEFTEVHGPLHFLLSFQVREGRLVRCEERAQTEVFLHRLSLTNARVKIHLRMKLDGDIYQRIISGKTESKVILEHQAVVMDVACHTQPPVFVGRGPWCQRGHPVRGVRLPLRIPPEAMEQGLYGELSLLPITILTPCVQQYPNLVTRLTRIQVLLYSPSNLPLQGLSAFLQQLSAHLACQELGFPGLSFTPSPSHTTTPEHNCCITVNTENGEPHQKTETERWPDVEQTLSVFLFFQHRDPFHSQLSDFVASEELLEHHLEEVLRFNSKEVTAVMNTALQGTLKDQQQRQKVHEKMSSALRVMLSSVSSVVSSSSNLEFRTACLDRMKVQNTFELSASLHQTLKRVTEGRCLPSSKCYSGQTHTQPGANSGVSENEI
ncbi:DUF4554 domain-containing protein [Osmerus eperlanus]|uniref:DUF4554 domain-containing protein n=1 Tax=Osmerus eperlanus TaxID=29151 RepID=UPI002E0D3694